ncbi:50S ribosomal protein L3 [Candidatus Woesearchaeota archaeon]|nr:50S ribosomal protein L3 [Candidatus Woesearchaeota archaeon]
MATTRNPRHGSLQFWPRKRARRQHSRIRHHPELKEPRLSGFAGYKVGMTHAIAIDNRPASHTKGNEIFMPLTVIECPPLKVASIRLYRQTPYGLKLAAEHAAEKADGEKLPEYEKEIGSYAAVRVNVETQPKLTGTGKKHPELFEMAIGGNVQAQLEYAKHALGKEVKLQDVFREGQQVDVYAVTKGKGFQGPVKRFGVTLRPHKSEKGRRGPGNLGPWTGNRSWTVAHAGKMGYHNRLERNKWIIKMADSAKGIDVKGGFLQYGVVRNQYMLLKGSVQGARKRLVKLMHAARHDKLVPEHAPQITHISLQSKQGK